MPVFIKVTSQPPAIFRTHYNYIECLESLLRGLNIQVKIPLSGKVDKNKSKKFHKLALITKASIDGEKSACDKEMAYSQVVAPWFPVKCYYMLYYLESELVHLINGSTTGFGPGGHLKIRDAIRGLICRNEIGLVCTHSAQLGCTVDWLSANSFRTTVGSNVRSNYYLETSCVDSIRKKLSDYIQIDWKLKEGIKNYRSLDARNKRTARLVPKTLCLLDYFYWMRIKANYRDVDFLDFDNNIDEIDAYNYLSCYLTATNHYASALMGSIDAIKNLRGVNL